jgi:hypothetical protein
MYRVEIRQLLDRDRLVGASIFADAAIGTEIGVNNCLIVVIEHYRF